MSDWETDTNAIEVNSDRRSFITAVGMFVRFNSEPLRSPQQRQCEAGRLGRHNSLSVEYGKEIAELIENILRQPHTKERQTILERSDVFFGRRGQ